jgi:hypothetical protein
MCFHSERQPPRRARRLDSPHLTFQPTLIVRGSTATVAPAANADQPAGQQKRSGLT